MIHELFSQMNYGNNHNNVVHIDHIFEHSRNSLFEMKTRLFNTQNKTISILRKICFQQKNCKIDNFNKKWESLKMLCD